MEARAPQAPEDILRPGHGSASVRCDPPIERVVVLGVLGDSSDVGLRSVEVQRVHVHHAQSQQPSGNEGDQHRAFHALSIREKRS